MSFLAALILSMFTAIGIKYVWDMIRFAMGEEVNGKRREPMIGPRKKYEKPEPEVIHYDWEAEFSRGA